MTANCKNSAFRMLFLIATPKLVNKGIDLFKKGNIPVQYVFHAQGTATSEIMDTLGLCGEEKNILISMMPKPFADESRNSRPRWRRCRRRDLKHF